MSKDAESAAKSQVLPGARQLVPLLPAPPRLSVDVPPRFPLDAGSTFTNTRLMKFPRRGYAARDDLYD